MPIIGFDVVEVAPALDAGDITLFSARKIILSAGVITGESAARKGTFPGVGQGQEVDSEHRSLESKCKGEQDVAAKILVIEDERPIADIIAFNLGRAGFDVSIALDGEDGLKRARMEIPDVILLDIMLPRLDGYAVCRAVRSFSNVPIIMLTAKDEEVDKVLGLEIGADDYVTKPFSPRELVARVKAVLRRSLTMALQGEVIMAGELTIDPATYEVSRSGERIVLTQREFELLRFLASHPGQVFSREVLLNQVWGYEYYGESRTVDVTIRRLREKIEVDAAQPEYIHTKRGVGYSFRAENG